MRIFFKLSPIFILLAAIHSPAAFSRSEFNEGYEAAQTGNYQRAIALWKPLAEKGDAAAQYTLGWMFESGQGVAQSYQQAIFWYRKAAMQGDSAAQYVLATMYKKGTGTVQDSQQAVKWFTKAAEQGDAIAQFELGVHFQKGLGIAQNNEQSLYWFKKAARQGHITSQINLGKIYQSGEMITADYQQAIKWYQKAASQNSALGQYHLAHMYEYGRGTPQDLIKAKSLYLQSSNNNYAPSAYKIADFYRLGKGVEIDLKSAITWYKKAAAKGYSNAQFTLGNLYQEGKGVDKNIRSAITWYLQAANQDHAKAHYQLGMLYKEGRVSKQKKQALKVNYKQAIRHFEKAVALGYQYANAHLGTLYEQGLGTDVDLPKALAFYQQAPQAWAKERYQSLDKRLNCVNSATTELFSVPIACTTREVLRKKIKQQKIVAITESNNQWFDNYYTGAVIRGTSELQVSYTRDGYFVSAEYTFIGRNNPALIGKIKKTFIERYGQPDKQIDVDGKQAMSFEWIMDDNIHLTLSRSWPDTTTFARYFSPEKQALQIAEQAQSKDINSTPAEPPKNNSVEAHLF